MDQNEKLAVQTVLMEELNRLMPEHPTLLVDALIGGQGHALVYHILSQQTASARLQADTLTHLLKAFTNDAQEPEKAAEYTRALEKVA